MTVLGNLQRPDLTQSKWKEKQLCRAQITLEKLLVLNND